MEVTQSATEALLKKGVVKAGKQAAKSKTAQVATKVADSNDLLLKTAYDLESLDKAKAFELAESLIENAGFDDFRLGGVLAVIQANSWLEGYESFKALIQDKFNLKYRKAMYLIEIYHSLVTKQIPWEKVKDLGWTKLQLIHKVLTLENLEDWVAKAKVLTAVQLDDLVKGKADGKPKVTSDISTLTFKVHGDQKDTIRNALDKAKAEVNTEFDSVALETICVGYLGGSISAASIPQASLKDVMAAHSMEEVLAAFEVQFPGVDLTVAVPEEEEQT